MKTYSFPEVYGHKETTEWVPADVALELLDVLGKILVDYIHQEEYNASHALSARDAIKKACAK